MATSSSGITNPDERSVAVVEWGRRSDGSSYISVDDVSRQYVLVDAKESDRFEAAADAQGWKINMVGYCDFTDRRTYALRHIPPSEFKALDLTKKKDAMTLAKAMRDRPKRFRTSSLREKAMVATELALDLLIGEMKDADQTGTTDEAKEAIYRRKMRATEVVATHTRNVATMEQVNQADEHLAIKNERLDAGLATENLGIQKTYQVDPSVEEAI